MSITLLSLSTPDEAAHILYPIVDSIVRTSIAPTARARDPQRTGGWFTYWRMHKASGSATPVIGFAVGEVSTERFMKYMHFANEKAMRLDMNMTHVSSWQSRDPSDPDPLKRKWGGAIHIPINSIFSFSGFSEHEDEMICAETGRQLGILKSDRLKLIINASDNEPLRSHMKRVDAQYSH